MRWCRYMRDIEVVVVAGLQRLWYRDVKQMEKNMENDMETGVT